MWENSAGLPKTRPMRDEDGNGALWLVNLAAGWPALAGLRRWGSVETNRGDGGHEQLENWASSTKVEPRDACFSSWTHPDSTKPRWHQGGGDQRECETGLFNREYLEVGTWGPLQRGALQCRGSLWGPGGGHGGHFWRICFLFQCWSSWSETRGGAAGWLRGWRGRNQII